MPPRAKAGEQDVHRILAHVREQIGQRRFGSWFDRKVQLELDRDELVVRAGSPYLVSWIQKHFSNALMDGGIAILGQGLRLRFDVDARLSLTPELEGDEATNAGTLNSVSRATRPDADTSDALEHDAPRSTNKSSKQAAPYKAGERRLSGFSDFVVGECNQLAHTAAKQVAGAPGTQFSPLYLYSGVGNGKTHLLEGICREVRKQYPSLNVLLLTAENFTNYFTAALREKSLSGFRQRFRNCDLLLVDDIDFLDGKKGIQEEFLHTIQQLESHGRQVVLTADRHPKMLTKLSDELVTRCLSGLVCRIDVPCDTTRRHIVRRLAERQRIDVTDGALDHVAGKFTASIRELGGAMNCLSVWGTMHKKRVGVTAARQVLASLERDCRRIIRMTDVESAVCRMFGVQSTDIKSPSRARTSSQPRMLAMYLSRRLTPCAYSEIGKYYGNRNHSTVVAAERRVQQMLDGAEELQVAAEAWSVRDIIQTLEQQIRIG